MCLVLHGASKIFTLSFMVQVKQLDTAIRFFFFFFSYRVTKQKLPNKRLFAYATRETKSTETSQFYTAILVMEDELSL